MPETWEEYDHTRVQPANLDTAWWQKFVTRFKKTNKRWPRTREVIDAWNASNA